MDSYQHLKTTRLCKLCLTNLLMTLEEWTAEALNL